MSGSLADEPQLEYARTNRFTISIIASRFNPSDPRPYPVACATIDIFAEPFVKWTRAVLCYLFLSRSSNWLHAFAAAISDEPYLRDFKIANTAYQPPNGDYKGESTQGESTRRRYHRTWFSITTRTAQPGASRTRKTLPGFLVDETNGLAPCSTLAHRDS